MNKKAFDAHLLVPLIGTRPNDVQRMLQALHYPVAVYYSVYNKLIPYYPQPT